MSNVTISQLPGTVQAVSGADILILEQVSGGTPTVVQVPVSSIVSLAQAGVLSLPINVGALPSGTQPTSADGVIMVQNGTSDIVPYPEVINSLTVSQLPPANSVSATDKLTLDQGGASLQYATVGALNTYVQGQLGNYHPNVVEITASLNLDNVAHNGHLLIVTQPVTLNPAFLSSGFSCTILPIGSGTVAVTGATFSNGASSLSALQMATLNVGTYSGGTIIFVGVFGGNASVPSAPGAPSGLTLGTVTSGSLAFSWTAPSTGGTPTQYILSYRTYGSSGAYGNPTYISYPTLTGTISGLAPGTQYDVEVVASNTGGTSSAVVYGQSPAATTGAATYAPNIPTALASGSPTTSSLTWTWTASASDSSHSAASGYYVETSPDGNTYSAPITLGNVTTYTYSGLSAGTTYYLRVSGFNGAGASSYTSGASGTTSASGYAPNLATSLTAASVTQASITWTWVAPATDSTHSAATGYYVETSDNGGSTWSAPTTLGNVLTYTYSGLSASTTHLLRVSAFNATGAAGYTSGVSGTTSAAGNYSLTTGYQPVASGTSYAHSSTAGGSGANVNIMTSSGDGSYTSPSSITFGWTNSTTAPTSTSQLTATASVSSPFTYPNGFSSGGHNYAVVGSMPTPSAAGTYYLWACAIVGGSIVATSVQCTGGSGTTPQAFTIT